jgi:SAM-dependent methyltransferase
VNAILLQTTSVRQRIGSWWGFRHCVFQRWILEGLADRKGVILKTDLYDEASGPHHHLRDLPAELMPVGVDADESICRLAQQNMRQCGQRADLVVADVRRLPFATESFSGIISLSTLDHFDHRDEIRLSIKELVRVLKLEGVLLLALDNPANPEVALRRWLPKALVRVLRADSFPLGESLHARQGSRELARAGLRVLDVEFLVHPVRYFCIRALAWLDRHPLGPVRTGFIKGVEISEGLKELPTGFMTGHYVAWTCRR